MSSKSSPSSRSTDTKPGAERRQRGRELRQGRGEPDPRGAGAAPRRGRAVKPRRNPLRVWLPVGLLVMAVVVAGAAYALRGLTTRIEGVVTFSNLGQGHQNEPVAYPQIPPAGGPHSPTWQNCGIYGQPIRSETALHSLEHGAVWITYQPELPAAEVEQLRNLVRGNARGLLSPFPGIPGRIMATAWNLQLTVESPDDPRLASFLDKYAGGSQAPEPLATCRGGEGTPQR